MANKGGRRKAPGRPDNPHHILTGVESGLVAQLQATNEHNQVLDSFAPTLTLEDIRHRIAKAHGPGKYTVVGRNTDGKLLPGYRLVEINPYSSEIKRINSSWSERIPGRPIPDQIETGHPMVTDQLKALEERERRLEERERRLEDALTSLNEQRQETQKTAHESEISNIRTLLTLQQELRSSYDLEMAKIHEQAETDRQRRDLEFRQREAEIRRETEECQSARRQEFEDDPMVSLRKAEMRLEAEKHQLEIMKLKAEMDQQIQAIRMQQITPGQVPMPPEMYPEYWRKKLEQEMPEPTLIEKIIEQIDPVLEFLNTNPAVAAAILQRFPAPANMPVRGPVDPTRSPSEQNHVSVNPSANGEDRPAPGRSYSSRDYDGEVIQ